VEWKSSETGPPAGHAVVAKVLSVVLELFALPSTEVIL
jgi:hypothetical protein